MKGKRWIIILSFLLLLGSLWLYLKRTNEQKAPQILLPKIQETTIPTPQEEPKLTPEPKATPITQNEKKRSIIGALPKDGLKGLHFLNSPSDEWKEKYKEELKRFQDPSSEINITLQESGVQIFPNKTAIYIEKVLVMIHHADGKEDSFNALVNSSTGKVIQTFNFVKRDDIPRQGEEKKGMTPTGVIRSSP